MEACWVIVIYLGIVWYLPKRTKVSTLPGSFVRFGKYKISIYFACSIPSHVPEWVWGISDYFLPCVDSATRKRPNQLVSRATCLGWRYLFGRASTLAARRILAPGNRQHPLFELQISS